MQSGLRTLFDNDKHFRVVAVAAGRMAFPHVDVRDLDLNPLAGLTEREREILESLSKGMTDRQLAEDFGISLITVKFHLKNLYGKMSVENRAQAIAKYLGRAPPQAGFP